MKRALGLRMIVSAVVLAAVAGAPAMAAEHKTEKKVEAPKEKKPKAPPKKSVCENRLLSYQQRYLCGQQLAKVQTKPELKQVEERYTKIVREVERKQKEEHE